MSPLTLSIVVPDSSLESIFDFLSRIAKTEATATIALLASGARKPD